ncbi:hypothetical protein FRC08_010289 [Ceratobasidium sp. 394]|nr:hypothetical protein FRC08_010289 [Ceratobasidium sp. 394]KAG9089561.1 hypothetical protein FS749_001235 [Ceratobasidium sp. UAMH 11750]
MHNPTSIRSNPLLPPLPNLTTAPILLCVLTIILVVGVYGRARFQFSTERNNYISGSLTSLGTSSRWSHGWSRPADRTHPLVIKFHKEWQHHHCRVMRWYENQSSSSRKFRSIEHRNTNGPFYHEFLLLRLTDDAICRLERLGEGSTADAIRDTGCTARDIIQWFHADDYAEFASEHPSVLISQVDLPSEYDILDVLAICYSIQNTNACRLYTLQRYNCYFLCLTVLAVLTRRAACWETEITPHVWDWNLDCALARLWSSPAQEVKEHQILQICAQLHPDDPHCSESLIEEVYSELCSDNNTASDMKAAVGSILWLGSLESETPLETARLCISALLTEKRVSPTRFPSLFSVDRPELGQPARSAQVMKTLCFRELPKWVRQILPGQAEILWNLCQMIGREWPIPFKTLAICWIYQNFLIVLMAVVHPAQTKDSGYRIAALIGHIGSVTSRRHQLPRDLGRISHGDVSQALPAPQPEMDIVESLRDFMFSVLLSTLKGALQRKPVDVIVKLRDDTRTVTQISGFQQEHMQARVRNHAERVAKFKLAASPQAVSRDIYDAVTAVWNSLPPGFGSVA